MSLRVEVIPYLLQFKFDARTSRGAMKTHQVYYLKLYEESRPAVYGMGECAPLPGLSLEYHSGFVQTITDLVLRVNNEIKDYNIIDLRPIIYKKEFKAYPSFVFALETAWLDLLNGGQRVLFKTDFTAGKVGIPINGLIWMGDKWFMQNQIREKLNQGYTCLKLKIGSLNFETELEIIREIRKVASPTALTIRVDANGAFSPADALSKLHLLSGFTIHSIEQPIKPGQLTEMQRLCQQTPVAIALDEELIGVTTYDQKSSLLQFVNPQFVIIKPTLVGGLKATAEWIEIAQKKKTGWWITSALESNIGLNAIAQFTAQYAINMEQGLGTGQLYHNNLESPLTIDKGLLFYEPSIKWGPLPLKEFT